MHNILQAISTLHGKGSSHAGLCLLLCKFLYPYPHILDAPHQLCPFHFPHHSFGSKNVVISKGLMQVGLTAVPMAIHG